MSDDLKPSEYTTCPECGYGITGPSEHSEEECSALQDCERDGHMIPAEVDQPCPRCGIYTGMDTSAGRWHAYLHHADETLTLLASGPFDFVTASASRWVYTHEVPKDSHVVLAMLAASTPVEDLVKGLEG